MSDKFTPLSFGSLPSASATVATAPTAAPAPVSSPFRSLPAKPAEPAAERCANPVITLQRSASGAVTSIRVQCGCGQVTELNCVY